MRHAAASGVVAFACALVLTAGCASHKAPDFGGRWTPINRFSERPAEIPLYTSYVYQAMPMDGTLKAMLERWARDSRMELAYEIGSDYTLYGAVAAIDTTSLQQAVSELSAAYTAQGVWVSVAGNRIQVRPVSTARASEPAAGDSGKG